MPSFGPNGLAIPGEGAVLAQAATRTADGNGPAIAMEEAETLRLTLNVTAAAGIGPSLTVTIQHSVDAITWTNHSSFAAVTGVASERKVFSGLDRYARVAWTMTGTTPSFTFAVTGEIV